MENEVIGVLPKYQSSYQTRWDFKDADGSLYTVCKNTCKHQGIKQEKWDVKKNGQHHPQDVKRLCEKKQIQLLN